MKKSGNTFFTEKEKYISPDIEIIEIEVEKGFAASVRTAQGKGTAASWDEVEDLSWD
ncbi:MAG: hypothetical protein GX330_07420 [Bacteroidales bacterium]|nr:hypothetical protein [Bacteroidales bacterium]